MAYLFDKEPVVADRLLRDIYEVLKHYKSVNGRHKPRSLIASLRLQAKELIRGDRLAKRFKEKNRWRHSCTVFYYGDNTSYNDVIYDYNESRFFFDEFIQAIKGKIKFINLHDKNYYFRLPDGSFYNKNKYFEYQNKAYPRSRYQLDSAGGLIDMNKEVEAEFYNVKNEIMPVKLSLEDGTEFFNSLDDERKLFGNRQLFINVEAPSILPAWFFLSMFVFKGKYRLRHKTTIGLSFKALSGMEFKPSKGHLDVFKKFIKTNHASVPNSSEEYWRQQLSDMLERYLNWTVNTDFQYGKANKVAKRALKTLFKSNFLSNISTEEFIKSIKMIKEIIVMEKGGENL